jgi:GMP synthase-like glutamine amidotransferase
MREASEKNAKKIILAIQNDPTDPPHLAGQWLSEIGFEIKTLRADLGEEVPVTVPENVFALMPLGGHMGALDDHIAPWLVNERALLADAVAKKVPIFAICLGAQLLAAATGGEVSRAQTSEIGIYEITRNQTSDPIFNFPAGIITAQWHEDQVSKLPPGAVCLASSLACANQIYRIGSNAYATQFHPEADASIIREWETNADHAFTQSGKTSVMDEVVEAEAELIQTWKPIVQSWGQLILGNTTK